MYEIKIHVETDFSEKENNPVVQWSRPGHRSQVAGDRELAARLEQRPAAIADHAVARARCEQQACCDHAIRRSSESAVERLQRPHQPATSSTSD
ncbi:UNVERIFIED_CONTAM: hypothetical protein Sradi_2052300 [Sesamum radiatum]|uniref:Uncharacterized protein n=1 Tax=Sesamum radiatum TaxID=300843 RepID=A0AAW2THU6_SESRA